MWTKSKVSKKDSQTQYEVVKHWTKIDLMDLRERVWMSARSWEHVRDSREQKGKYWMFALKTFEN